MFNTPFPHDPFRRLPISTPFSYANYFMPQPHLPSPPPHRRSHRYRPHRPSFYTDADSHPSDQDDTQEGPYYMDHTMPSDSPFPDRPTHRRRRQWTPDTTATPTPPDLDMDSEFRRTSIRLPRKAAEKLERDTILILPSTLTRLRVYIRSPYSGGGSGTTDALHVVVAGDMRFRDVLRQLIGTRARGQAETRAFVRIKGAWVEPGVARVSEVVEQGRWVVDERGEVEVKIEVGGVEKEGRESGKRGIKAWERETGRAWETSRCSASR
ncbi:hypothetical protein TUN199_10514 [Pyrenophora tritici-repentis]|uniref:Uncharacterized protein n=3 Tax=Pyrenophora tritici-repentis TaxID=45151 RepID=A0A2W1HU65_9PLEO|nr:uncharacterized protein PTRG_01013 [Pyrenophora tritici-repentis Pt-1C-BFP]KAI0572249.1 hypothetical protein Alg130_10581 [Pyrenophora tritici-repentis]EDU40451.1 predicted protein [Pyrenophora tritici-repentis Pt-1C-BFP]KAI0581128.1 hypothetical protein Alg215_04827 [Pyrenophora tritici-repentis]KAI0605215.1 hypothetical protein TUN205_10541 [Pyrenophora tritici-repentis]KAI0617497.1 hypothetical protein TUN199_10514 [Pyrenophora tritici-repentis]